MARRQINTGSLIISAPTSCTTTPHGIHVLSAQSVSSVVTTAAKVGWECLALGARFEFPLIVAKELESGLKSS